MGGVDYRILGSLEASREGAPLALGGAKQKTLLALLLLAQSRVVTTDELIEAIWREDAPAKPSTALQGYVSHLRKALDPEKGFELIVTEPAGYRLKVERDQLDLFRLEELLEQGRTALAGGNAGEAASSFRAALVLFRGPPLADFTYEPWAQAEVGRLEELRLACLEDRIEADLALGRHAEVVGELEALIKEFPLRESLRAHHMLALYRSGRQSEALAAYQEARNVLVEEFGIDPTRGLQELERKILTQDESLDLGAPGPAAPIAVVEEVKLRSILVVSRAEDDARRLADLTEPLAGSNAPHELIVARLIDASGSDAGDALVRASTELNALRSELAEQERSVRVAAFTSEAIGPDINRLASEQDAAIIVVDLEREQLEAGSFDEEVASVLAEALCDVALCLLGEGGEAAVSVPFGGSEHDWAALELGAWLASSRDSMLRLLGVEADTETGQRDASRLLAAASLAVQGLVGVPTVPVLVSAGTEQLIKESEGSTLVVGLPADWSERGLGDARRALARDSKATVFFVRRGLRPGGLAPPASQTRYTWSLADMRTG